MTQTEAFKLALEALELCNGSETVDGVVIYTDKEIAAIKEALAQPEQEPVAEITAEDMGRPFNAIRIGTHFYKEVPPVGTKLYTSPPASKPWVGLTDDEIDEKTDFRATVRYFEAKLKEKNT